MQRLLWLFLMVLVLPAQAATPLAEVICAPKDQMQQRLEGRMQSARTASGLRSPEEMVEIWTDAEGDWAMVISYASGQSCIVAMGEYWQMQRNPA